MTLTQNEIETLLHLVTGQIKAIKGLTLPPDIGDYEGTLLSIQTKLNKELCTIL